MAEGKRVRDPNVHRIRDAFQALLAEVVGYHDQLSAELAKERASDEPYPPLMTALERQIERLAAFQELLEEDGLQAVIDISNTSGYVSHTRTREFF
jgi:hypothetical protein